MRELCFDLFQLLLHLPLDSCNHFSGEWALHTATNRGREGEIGGRERKREFEEGWREGGRVKLEVGEEEVERESIIN